MEIQSMAPDQFYCRRGHPKKSQLIANYLPSSSKPFSVLSLSQSKIIFEAEETKLENFLQLRTFLHEYVKGSHKKVSSSESQLET